MMAELLLKGARMAEVQNEEVFEEGDEPLSPEELDERRQFMDEVFEDLCIIRHKEVEISSTAYPGQVRKYYVEDLEKVHVPGKRGFISAIRFLNHDVSEVYQPTLKYPTDSVKCKKVGGRTIYTMVYSYDPNVLNSFRHIYKKTKPDMRIYIEFTE